MRTCPRCEAILESGSCPYCGTIDDLVPGPARPDGAELACSASQAEAVDLRRELGDALAALAKLSNALDGTTYMFAVNRAIHAAWRIELPPRAGNEKLSDCGEKT